MSSIFSRIIFVILSLSVASSYIIDARAFESSESRAIDGVFMLLEADNNVLKIRWSIIFPKTKWCGTGNIARSYTDLGKERRTDICCRAHDFCADIIPAGETKHGLTNKDIHSKLSCKCDDAFRKCLRKTDSVTADTVGRIYFDILGTQCFSLDWFGYRWYDVKTY